MDPSNWKGHQENVFFLCFDSMPINQHVNSCCVVDVFQSLLIPLLPNMIVIDQICPRLIILEEHDTYYETFRNLLLVIHLWRDFIMDHDIWFKYQLYRQLMIDAWNGMAKKE
jgi:hypothetical protein